ncbi:hypothetical protein GGS24DRAFT_359705 [Hypoxylon argillaceum]|nr:hypothetical protein GGS24DRAFT_359705 [Hypoxylon argillaceum]
MVDVGGADANADADATSSRFGSRWAEEEEDVNRTPSGQASNLPRRATASLSRDGDDKLECHRTVGWVWAGLLCSTLLCSGLVWVSKQTRERQTKVARSDPLFGGSDMYAVGM